MEYRTTETRPESIRRRLVTGVVTAALSLALASCASDDGGAAAGGGGAAAGEISFTEPTADAEVSSPVSFTLDSGGEPIGEPETGNRHFHVYVDDSSDYEIIYATEGEVEVPEGEHTLRAVLAEPNHDELDVTTEVDVNVTGGAPAGGEQEEEDSGPYGY